jgi:acyl-CoA synthetase (AMP-forming)/AMP-acid ligase II
VNLAMILEMAADAFGDRIAIGNADDGLSYEGLRRAARAIADRVEDSGAKHLALIEPNGPVVPAVLFGAAWAGVSYAPLNYRLPDGSLQELIARIEPSITAGSNWVDAKSGSERRRRRRPRSSNTISSSHTCSTPWSSGRPVRTRQR